MYLKQAKTNSNLCSDPGFQERLFNILGQDYACNMDYSFETCQHRGMLKFQVDYHRYALRDRESLLQGIPLCNRVSKKVSKAQILRGHLREGATSLQSWFSRQVLGAAGEQSHWQSRDQPLTTPSHQKQTSRLTHPSQHRYNKVIMPQSPKKCMPYCAKQRKV